MTAEYGAATQLEKIDMLDFADASRSTSSTRARPTRCATSRSSASATTTRSTTKPRPSGLRHAGVAVQRPRHERAVPGAAAEAHGDRAEGAGRAAAEGRDAPATATNVIIPPSRSRYLAEIAETCGRPAAVGGAEPRARGCSSWHEQRRALRTRKRQASQTSPTSTTLRRRARRPARSATTETRSKLALAEWPAMRAGLRRRRIRRHDPRQGDPHAAASRVAVAPRSARSRCRGTRTGATS